MGLFYLQECIGFCRKQGVWYRLWDNGETEDEAYVRLTVSSKITITHASIRLKVCFEIIITKVVHFRYFDSQEHMLNLLNLKSLERKCRKLSYWGAGLAFSFCVSSHVGQALYFDTELQLM